MDEYGYHVTGGGLLGPVNVVPEHFKTVYEYLPLIGCIQSGWCDDSFLGTPMLPERPNHALTAE